jgi:Xaa-Pro aminopeptidase
MTNNLHFTEEEYQQRVRQTKAAMDRCGMEMLLVMDPANMNYLTGYDGWSFYVHQGVIISLDTNHPLMVWPGTGFQRCQADHMAAGNVHPWVPG